MWQLLNTIAERVTWHGEKLTADEWKIFLTAHFKGQKQVPGIDGQVVVIGRSTSSMDKHEMTDFIEFVYWFGSERGIDFSKETG